MARAPTKLSIRLVRLRALTGLTQDGLADLVGVPSGRSAVAAWEGGTQPTAQWIMPLATALGVTAVYLLTGADKQKGQT